MAPPERGVARSTARGGLTPAFVSKAFLPHGHACPLAMPCPSEQSGTARPTPGAHAARVI